MHLLFCAHLINIFPYFTGVGLKTFFPSEMGRGCLVCIICNSNSFHSLIFRLCIIIVHTLKMCTSYLNFFSFFRGVELRQFFHRCLVCVICNSNSFHIFIFKLCILIDVHLLQVNLVISKSKGMEKILRVIRSST